MRPFLRGPSKPVGKVRVVLVENDPRLLRELAEALSADPELEVAGGLGDARTALEEISRIRPELIVLDPEFSGLDGIALIAPVKQRLPETEVLIWTIDGEERRIYEAIRAGAAGYLLKQAGPEQIRTAIRQIIDGGTVIEPLIGRKFWAYFQSVRSGPGLRRELTKREVEILQFLAKGLSNAEVGSMLAMGRRSIRTQLSHIYRKMGVRTHVEAVAIAVQTGLIEV